MTEERFRTLADAHGGDIGRWPAADQAAARAFAAGQAMLAAQILAEAGRLDVLLFADGAAAPSAELREAIIARAPTGRAGRPRRWAMGAGLGLGLAAACAAGVAAGVLLAPPSVVRLLAGAPPSPADDVSGLVAPAGQAGGV